jgi:hypothetical protein
MRINKYYEKWKPGSMMEAQQIKGYISEWVEVGTSKEKLKKIDEYFNYPNLLDRCETWLKEQIDIISKFDIDDIDYRLTEFSDKMIDWSIDLFFALYRETKSSKVWTSINMNRINDPFYIRDRVYNAIILELLSQQTNQIDNLLNSIKPCIVIDLENTNSRTPLPEDLLDGIADDIVLRLSKFYTIGDVWFGNPRKGKGTVYYDVFEYRINVELK